MMLAAGPSKGGQTLFQRCCYGLHAAAGSTNKRRPSVGRTAASYRSAFKLNCAKHWQQSDRLYHEQREANFIAIDILKRDAGHDGT